MKKPNYVHEESRMAYRRGYQDGYKEGLKKAAMLIQLMSSSTDAFERNILQNSKEAVELRKIMTGSE